MHAHALSQEVGKFSEQGCQVVLVASGEVEYGKPLLEKLAKSIHFYLLRIYCLNVYRYDISLPFYLDRDRALYWQMGLGRTPEYASIPVVEVYATLQLVGKGRDPFGPG